MITLNYAICWLRLDNGLTGTRKEKSRQLAAFLLTDGRGERIRTSDPYNPIVVRYQAALRSDRIELPLLKEQGLRF